ncbi:MAG: D-Ala-D-Ala carboxypeptidase family metallohydrolase [Hyphomonas sp.]
MLIASYKDVPMAGWRWPHFTPLELACKCPARGCRGEYWHDPVFLDGLEALRAAAGRPLRINSGHRCSVRNHLAGGAPRSRHRRIAVDIALRNHDRHALMEAAAGCGFTGIGRGRTFLHLDRRPIPATWTCKGAEASWQI